jgi:hypothetical protein
MQLESVCKFCTSLLSFSKSFYYLQDVHMHLGLFANQTSEVTDEGNYRHGMHEGYVQTRTVYSVM